MTPEPDEPLHGNWPASRSVPVSVLIPVKNEEANIVECIRHVHWAEQVVVVDSQSTDRTVPLAESLGAEVFQFHYAKEGWPKKKNWALESVPWRHEWVLIVDADEHFTPEFVREIAAVVSRDAEALVVSRDAKALRSGAHRRAPAPQSLRVAANHGSCRLLPQSPVHVHGPMDQTLRLLPVVEFAAIQASPRPV